MARTGRRGGGTVSGPLGGPRPQPVDPVHALAELCIRLEHDGHTPGPRYDTSAAIAAMASLLGLMDIPTKDTTWSRRIARRLTRVGRAAP